MSGYVNTLLFGIYPYIALAVLAIGTVIRYDREPYTWRSGSSQLLRRRQFTPQTQVRLRLTLKQVRK